MSSIRLLDGNRVVIRIRMMMIRDAGEGAFTLGVHWRKRFASSFCGTKSSRRICDDDDNEEQE